MMEIISMAIWGGVGWGLLIVTGYEGCGGASDRNVHVDWGDGYIGAYIYQNSSNCTLKMGAVYINFISKVDFKKHNEISHFMPMKMTEIKMSNNTKCWWGW